MNAAPFDPKRMLNFTKYSNFQVVLRWLSMCYRHINLKIARASEKKYSRAFREFENVETRAFETVSHFMMNFYDTNFEFSDKI